MNEKENYWFYNVLHYLGFKKSMVLQVNFFEVNIAKEGKYLLKLMIHN